MAKPRALFLLNLPPPVHGMAMMGKYVMESKVVNEAFDAHYMRTTMARSLADIGHGTLRKIPMLLRFLAQVRREIRAFKPELVYFTPNSRGGAFLRDAITLACVKCWTRHRVPIVLHFHNKGVAAGAKKPLFRFLYRRFFRDVTVMLLSERLYSDVAAFVPRERVVICPNGMPPTRPFDAPPIERPVRDVPRIFFLSNLIIAKGVLVLLDALRILRERGVAFACDFVGGEDELNAEQFAAEVSKRGLDGAVVYHGRKYDAEKIAFFENSDLFVFPSKTETFGLVAAEAMEYELPVVATDVGGVPDVVRDGETGIVIPTTSDGNGLGEPSPHALADALAKLLSDPALRARYGTAGRAHFLADYTLDRFETLFTHLLQGACN